jgi:ATP-dependent Clp protease ATP-binding subunit ClpA
MYLLLRTIKLFEKFTEKAIEVVKSAQIYAIEFNHEKIYPEHLLLALLNDTNSIIVKTFSIHKVELDELRTDIVNLLNKRAVVKPVEFVVFSDSSKDIFTRTLDIAKMLGNSYVKTEHIFLAIWESSKLELTKVLEEKGVDVDKMKTMFYNIFSAKKNKKVKHPEIIEKRRRNDRNESIISLIESSDSAKIFDRAIAKLSTSNYEILGTEQIMQSILEDESSDVVKTLAEFGVTAESFSNKLQEVSSRQAEFGDKQIIFTPNALKTLMLALDIVREAGNASILPEHIILGLLKSKQGIAYNILKELNVNENLLEEKVVQPLEKQKNETLYIMRLAKQEARRIGNSVVGSELILLGIVLEANSIAAEVLRDLGVIVKDAREVIEQLIGVSDDYASSEITFSQRAKLILEDAWNIAKSQNKTKTTADDLLIAICNQPDSVAMKALTKLGVDALEIRQGLRNRLEDIRI